MNNIIMRQIDYLSKDYEDSVDIRNEVFRKPQGLDIRDEDLSSDKDMVMYGGFIDNKMMATIFYLPLDQETAQVKSVIVIDEYRNLGLGRYLMEFIEDEIKAKGFKKIKLMARVTIQGFYEKLGYKPISESFLYYKTPHLYMEKYL